jgi:hypothetical protein
LAPLASGDVERGVGAPDPSICNAIAADFDDRHEIIPVDPSG